MLMKNWMPFTSGFFAFVAAHLIEAAKWNDWFRGQYRPWFLNSGRAMLFTATCVFVVSAIVALRSDGYLARASSIAIGAVTAMFVVLFVGGDPGTIFPIVIATGAVVLTAIAFAGALAARAFRAQ